jgi:hypothetical protein
MNIRRYLDVHQRKKLDEIREIVRGFYEGHDNAVTYALTGLLTELVQENFVDERYIREKIELLAQSAT